MQNMSINNPYYIGDAIIVMFGFSVLICHPPNLLDKFGEQIWRERPEKALKLDFSGGRPSAYRLYINFLSVIKILKLSITT